MLNIQIRIFRRENLLPELLEIKKKRKTLGITQTELSKETGVSQSLIAKIESNNIVPSYTNAKKIFDFFELIHEKQDAKAAELMTSKMISVRPDANIRSAIKLMEKNSVSQMPVIEDGRNVGTISEKTILEKINKNKDAANVLDSRVDAIMEEAMPELREDSPFQLISSTLSHYPGVIVVKKGKVTGIITKSDLLNATIKNK